MNEKQLMHLKKSGFGLLQFLTAIDWEDYIEIVYCFTNPKNLENKIIKIKYNNKKIKSLSKIYPTAKWHERETAEMFGIEFEDKKYEKLLLYDLEYDGFPMRKNWMGKFRLNIVQNRNLSFGPQHPGSHGPMAFDIDNSGNFVNGAKAKIGFVHRCLEKIAESRTYFKNIPVIERICIMEGMTYLYLWADAIEKLGNIEVPERAKYIRVLALELNRISSHLLWLAEHSGDFGFETMTMWVMKDREYILDLLEEMTGWRITFAYIVPGGVRNDIPKTFKKKIIKISELIQKRVEFYKQFLLGNEIFIKRTKNIGKITQKEALDFGVTGPFLRSTGFDFDLRKNKSYLVYDKIKFNSIVMDGGDVYSRDLARLEEIKESAKIISQIMHIIPEGKIRNPVLPMLKINGEILTQIEAARGLASIYLIADGTDKPYRVKIRGPSFSNMQGVEFLLNKGISIHDIPVILGSADICPADLDR